MEPNESNLPLDGEPKPEKSCWTSSRCELRAWLRRNAASIAELYEGAVLLLFDSPIPGYTRFVAHAVREARNRLPEAISGTKSGGRLDYVGRMDAVVVAWKKTGLPTDGSFPPSHSTSTAVTSADEETALPLKIVSMFSSLVTDHEAARERPIDAAVRLFEGVAPENQKFRDALRPTILQWLDITNWFMRKTHDAGVTDGEINLTELRKKFDLFELTLLGIVRGFSTFFVATKEIDEILEDANS